MRVVIARADKLAGQSAGFVNPSLYQLSANANAVQDVLPIGEQDQSRADFANSIDDSEEVLFSARILDYEGPEQFCVKFDSIASSMDLADVSPA
jgi:hypothetical protein